MTVITDAGGASMEFRLDGTRVVLDVHPRVNAWFTTRKGGVSSAPFDTLNLSYSVDDLPANIVENRRRALLGSGRGLNELVMPHQIHQNHIEWVGPEHKGRGARGQNPISATDGLFTESDALVLGMGFADCVPIYLTDADAQAVGILHAGWRGTAAQIQKLGVEQLVRRGIDRRRILAGIGPSIGPCCYEVDRPVYDAISAVAGGEPLVQKDEEHWWLDLKKANRILLQMVGVLPENIVEAPFCTGCRSDLFFSYRVEGRRSGRMGGYICLKNK